MITQMRQHYQKIDKVLTDLPVKGDQWRMWLDHHRFQVSYFQANRQVYVLVASGLLPAVVLGGMIASWQADPGLWLATGLLVAVEGAIWYYLCLYTRWLHLLEEQSEQLFEKTLLIETKPNLTMAKYVAELATNLVAGFSQKWKNRRDVSDWE